ncbi:LAME_0F02872g1_1 [Lachancea meyersii CBS 8951]|uniref:LAME_0F02872g1_1 n=1 Tax=Lachancea meyersii CBS 8951 TaxID=1266667 RepID=A0A1G4JQS7_9SACH|nr:LAME_0F02872g1_1 [Lachancea meyersii CBS 8951]
MATVASLGANWCVTIQYTKEHLSELLTELSAKGLHALTRPGHSTGLLYVFVSDPNDKVPLIVSKFKYIDNVVALPSPVAVEEKQKLAQRLVKRPLMVSDKDIEDLVRVTGSPQVGMYFAFEKYYTRCLMLLALVGTSFRFFAGQGSAWEFNFSYTILVMLWAIGFVSTWKNKVRSQYAAKVHYVPTKSQTEPMTRTVFAKKLCFIPIALQFAACLIAFQFGCFLLEIFITQIYQGPLSALLALTPTVLISAYVPILTMVYDMVLDKLIVWENPANPVQSRLEKKFVLTFLTSYVPLFITLFVYLPMGHHVNAQLQPIAQFCSRYHIPVLASGFKVNTGRYQSQYFFFMVTGQIIALLVENVLPFTLTKLIPKIKGLDKPTSAFKQAETKVSKEYPEDVVVWKRASESSLSVWGEFDINAMTNKLLVQFGYVAMFSCIWPLASLVCVAINLVSMKLEIWRCLNKCVSKSQSKIRSETLSSRSASVNDTETLSSALLSIMLFVSALVSSALVTMYKSPSGESIQSILEKRDSWHLNSVVQVDWKTVLIGAFTCEHLAFLCYLVAAEFVGRSDLDANERFISAKKLEEPPHVNLNKVVKETADFMEKPEKNRSSTVASKAQVATKDSGPRRSLGLITTTSTSSGYSKASEISRPSQPVNTGKGASVSERSTHNGQPFPSFSQPTKTNKSSTSSISPVAGATVPDTIPTSKNYHLRRDQGNGSIPSNSEEQQSSGSNDVPKMSPETSNTSKLEELHQEDAVPKFITTSPSDEAIVVQQFVPPQISDTSKSHVAKIMNDGGPQKDVLQESGSDGRHWRHSDEIVGEKNGDRYSDHSSGAISAIKSQNSHTPRKASEKSSSSKKKIKGVLSPLNKLKKKFP